MKSFRSLKKQLEQFLLGPNEAQLCIILCLLVKDPVEKQSKLSTTPGENEIRNALMVAIAKMREINYLNNYLFLNT